MIQFEGIVETEIFKSEGFGILTIKVNDKDYPSLPRNEKGRTTISGPISSVSVGEKIKVSGTYTDHKEFGKQVAVTSFEKMQPSSETEMVAFLKSRSFGIGPKLAERIVEHFGESTFDILDNHPHRLAEVNKIGQKKAASIAESWSKERHMSDVMMFFTRCGITPSIASKVLCNEWYSVNTIDKIEQDPYDLCRQIRGVGFLTADEIAKKLGIPETSSVRIRAVAYHMLEEAASSEGHCYLQTDHLYDLVYNFLSNSTVKKEDIKSVLSASFIEEMIIKEDDRCYMPYLYSSESKVAGLLKDIQLTTNNLDSNKILKAYEQGCKSCNFELNQKQKEAIWNAINSKVSVMTGGGGVGKTSCVNAVSVAASHLGYDPIFLAPTGRAAKKLSESTGRKARTIHSFIIERKKEKSPVSSFFVVDEMSMVDVVLVGQLLSWINSDSKILFVGDINQLPSIGPGSVLKDVIESGSFPVTTLTEIHRQAQGSDIVKASRDINDGSMPMLKVLDSAVKIPKTDFFTIFNDDAEKLSQYVVYMATKFAAHLGFDVYSDVQIIAPMNTGSVGIKKLNTLMQSVLNPLPQDKFQRWDDEFWCVGDKIINKLNWHTENLMNGDICVIKAIHRKNNRVEEILVSCDDRNIVVPKEKFKNFRLAYVISIHSSQGSQWPYTVFVMHTSHYVLLQRNLLYTALTRAQRVAVMCASSKALSMAINNNKVLNRNSFLSNKV